MLTSRIDIKNCKRNSNKGYYKSTKQSNIIGIHLSFLSTFCVSHKLILISNKDSVKEVLCLMRHFLRLAL